jgi:hypothetical protein
MPPVLSSTARPPVALLFGLAFTIPGAACHRKVTQADCTAMLDRYLDMVIAADPSTRDLPPAQATAVREMKRAVKKAERSYAQVQTQCETEVSKGEYECAMKANIPDEWEACIE